MPFPVSVIGRLVEGQILDTVDGTPRAGTITFWPDVTRLVDTADNVVLERKPEVATLDDDGIFSIELICTDNAVLNPINWTYRVTVRLDGVAPYSYSVAIPQGATPLRWEDIVPVATSAGVPTLVGPQGPAGPGPLLIFKSADEVVNNSAVYQDDGHLVFPVGTNQLWVVSYVLFVVGDLAADMKAQIAVPAGATAIGGIMAARVSDLVMSMAALGTGAFGVDATVRPVRIEASVETAGVAGNVVLQWAQNVATAVNTTVKRSSYLLATQAE
jgi:hypothetical protein